MENGDRGTLRWLKESSRNLSETARISSYGGGGVSGISRGTGWKSMWWLTTLLTAEIVIRLCVVH